MSGRRHVGNTYTKLRGVEVTVGTMEPSLMRVLEFAAVCTQCRSVGYLQTEILSRTLVLTNSDVAVYLQAHPAGAEEVNVTWPDHTMKPAEMQRYCEVMSLHPLASIYSLPTLPTSVVRLSDAITQRDWRRHPLYTATHRNLGVDDQMVTFVGMRSGRFHMIGVSRLGRSYSDLERQLLALLQPSLQIAVRQAIASAIPYEAVRVAPIPVRTTFVGDAIPVVSHPLTTRERVIVSLLGGGHTSAAIARTLGVQTRTVEKHLENAFAKLRVTNRGDAVRRFEQLATHEKLPTGGAS